ncbi:MAG: class I SAM-dependent methyltransferase [Candidatus Omnitrophica bacterium]|nr:class I SAM-dependent methyltransferase [Candidatus Omnitrophota bacterium]
MQAKTEKEFFNRCADKWDEKETVTPEKYRRIIKNTYIENKQDILDVGTGTGVLIPYILEAAGQETTIFAIDYAEKMIDKFLLKNFPDNVKPFVMDIHKTDFENDFFDRVIVNSCYPHFKDKIEALKEIYRIMKPGGICTICHPTGNKHVNHVHRETSHPLIERHLLENMSELRKSVESAGFRFLKGIDEPDFFLISFTK